MTASSANIPKDEERGRSIIPAFPEIWAARFFTDGMELVRLGELTEFLVMGT